MRPTRSRRQERRPKDLPARDRGNRMRSSGGGGRRVPAVLARSYPPIGRRDRSFSQSQELLEASAKGQSGASGWPCFISCGMKSSSWPANVADRLGSPVALGTGAWDPAPRLVGGLCREPPGPGGRARDGGRGWSAGLAAEAGRALWLAEAFCEVSLFSAASGRRPAAPRAGNTAQTKLLLPRWTGPRERQH